MGSDGLGASPPIFPSVVFKSGNNGPPVWEGPRIVPQMLAAKPLEGQKPLWPDSWTMDRDLGDEDSKYSWAGVGAHLCSGHRAPVLPRALCLPCEGHPSLPPSNPPSSGVQSPFPVCRLVSAKAPGWWRRMVTPKRRTFLSNDLIHPSLILPFSANSSPPPEPNVNVTVRSFISNTAGLSF